MNFFLGVLVEREGTVCVSGRGTRGQDMAVGPFGERKDVTR